ncbi:MAG: DUF488 domain-containing protein [Acidobacteria bacterium]|nr:DUF488 domain-containing protein [Acidobacteriota bacterium]
MKRGEKAMEKSQHLFTIGHSNTELLVFLATLRQFGITLLVDVRSRPTSYRFPHFSQPELEQSLRESGISYLFMGEELGGRPDDPKAYREDGLVNYRVRRKARDFQAGIERVLEKLDGSTLALMCAEEDPVNCHRFLLICPELVARGAEPQHIRKGGVLETQRAAEDRVLEAHHLGDFAGPWLFPIERADALEDAYDRQAEKCAFRADPQTIEYW